MRLPKRVLFSLAFYLMASECHSAFIMMIVWSFWPSLFDGVMPGQRRRVAWAVHRTGDFFHKLGQPSEFGTWASYGELYESKMFNHWFRIDKTAFHMIHDLIKDDPSVYRKDTKCRRCVSSDKRLAMTLIWLAHGMHFKILGEAFGLGTSTAHGIVHGTVEAMNRVLPNRFISFPRGAALQRVMADFMACS